MITLSPIDPIKALFWSAVINGVVGVPVMVMMMLITSNKTIMREFAVTGVRRIRDGRAPHCRLACDSSHGGSGHRYGRDCFPMTIAVQAGAKRMVVSIVS